jgi:hypothetical protein
MPQLLWYDTANFDEEKMQVAKKKLLPYHPLECDDSLTWAALQVQISLDGAVVHTTKVCL